MVLFKFEPMKNANIFKDFYSDSAPKLVRNLPVALKNFNNLVLHEYREKLFITSNYAMQHWKLLKRF